MRIRSLSSHGGQPRLGALRRDRYAGGQQGRIKSSTQTITQDGPRIIAWPLANFSVVDLNAVSSITLDVAPNFAADMRLDLFEIVGPPLHVPLLSSAAMLALVVVLAVLGLTSIVRSL